MAEPGPLVRRPVAAIAPADTAGLLDRFLARIRGEWQEKGLIQRVKMILPVDPSSACQRLFNAAIHDLREKIVRAGIDVASQSAMSHKLPRVDKAEDVRDNYSVTHVIDLAFRMGILSRPSWRKLHRVYGIRRDLEHEDDEYVASPEDCHYVFSVCVDHVLAVDPVEILRIEDVKQVVESDQLASPSKAFLDDFAVAPVPRQVEIGRYLLSLALSSSEPDVVQKNSIRAIESFAPLLAPDAKIELAVRFNEQGKRDAYSLRELRVAAAAGLTGLLRTARVEAFLAALLAKLEEAGAGWHAYEKHGALLDQLAYVGGLAAVPDPLLANFVKWCVRCYVGKVGGVTQYGHVREVFYSDIAAPRIESLMKEAASRVAGEFQKLRQDPSMAVILRTKVLARRFEELADIVGS